MIKGMSTLSATKSLEDFFVLEDISCTDAEGNVFEHYDSLLVAKNVLKDKREKEDKEIFTPYNAIAFCEQGGLFLPSLALSCNILAKIVSSPLSESTEEKHFLLQYRDRTYLQNTVVDWEDERVWKKGTIVHYPENSDFVGFGGRRKVNAARTRVVRSSPKLPDLISLCVEEVAGTRIVRPTPKSKFISLSAEAAAAGEQTYEVFLRNLTGLQDISLLTEIGRYFGNSTWISTPQNVNHPDDAWYSSTRIATIGYGIKNLEIDLSVPLQFARPILAVCELGS